MSKKVGKAVVRNKVKRRMREAVREELPQLRGGHMLVFVARPAAAEADYRSLCRDMRALLRKQNLYRSAEADS